MVEDIFLTEVRDFRSPIISITGKERFCRVFIIFHAQNSRAVEMFTGRTEGGVYYFFISLFKEAVVNHRRMDYNSID